MSVVSLKDVAFQRLAQAVRQGHSIELDDPSKVILLKKIITTDLPTAALFLSGKGHSDMRAAALKRFDTADPNELKELNLPIDTAAALYMSDNSYIKAIGFNQINKSIPYQAWFDQPEGQQLFKALSSNEFAFSKYINHDTLLTLTNMASRPDLRPSLMLFTDALTSENVIAFGNENPETLKSVIHHLMNFANKGFDEASCIIDLLIASSQPVVRDLPNIESIVEIGCKSTSHASEVTNLCKEFSEKNINDLLQMHPSIKNQAHSILEKMKPGVSVKDIRQIKSELFKKIELFASFSSSIIKFEHLFHSPENNFEWISKIAFQSSQHATAMHDLMAPVLQDELKPILQSQAKAKKQIEIILRFVKENGDIAHATQMMKHSINLILQIYKPAT